MSVFLNLLLAVLGLIFGSFVSAFSWRYPKGMSVLKGRSFCPKCGKQIAWFDNIPVLSYIFLGGKCRRCGKKISWRYPVIEAVAGIGFLLIGPSVFNLILFLILLAIFVIDFEYQIIPDTLVFTGMFVSIFNSQFMNNSQLSIFNFLLAGFIAASFLLLIHLITKGRGMGLGDVKFALLGGMITGLKFVGIWMLLAFLTGGAIGAILILARRAGLKDQIAFGPFLVIAIPITLIWGEKILTVLG